MRLFSGVIAAALLSASGVQAATVASASVRTLLGFTVTGGDANDLGIAITGADLIELVDLAGPVSVTSSLAAADDATGRTEVDLAAQTGLGGGLIDLVGLADLSVELTNTGNAPLTVMFSVQYALDAAASVGQPLSDYAYAFSSIDVSSTITSIAFFASLDTLLGPMPPALADVYAPLAFVLDPSGSEFIDIFTEAQIVIDAAPIPLPPAGLLLIASVGALAGLRSVGRKGDVRSR